MNKEEFLSAFGRALDSLGVPDQKAHLAFYEELFSDMSEEGFSEGEISARLGDPWKLAEALFHEENGSGGQSPGSNPHSARPREQSGPETNRGSGKAGGWSARLKHFLDQNGIYIKVNGKNVFRSGGDAANDYHLSPDGVSELEIEWFTGTVEVYGDNRQDILLTECANTNAPPMLAEIRGACLYISFSESQVYLGHDKDLTVSLPFRLANGLNRCRINGVSADIDLSGLRVHDLSTKTVSGDQSIRLSADKAVITTASGDLELELEGREITAASASGDINMTSASGGAVKLSSSSGDVESRGAVERLLLTSASGDLWFSGSVEQIRAKTATGDCTLELDNCPKAVDLTTVSGDLDMELPQGSACQLQLNSRSGDVHFSGIRTDVSDAPVYTLATVSGDIDVHC